VILSVAVLPIQGAITMNMSSHHCIAIRLSKMQHQKLLMVCWRSFFGGCSDIITTIFAHKGGQYCDYGLMLLHSPMIIWDARPNIIDDLLTLISRMRQPACRFPFFYKDSQYFLFGRRWLCSPLIVKGVSLKIVDALLTFTWKTY